MITINFRKIILAAVWKQDYERERLVKEALRENRAWKNCGLNLGLGMWGREEREMSVRHI